MTSTRKISEPDLKLCHKYHSYINNYLVNKNNSNLTEEVRFDLNNASNYSEFLNVWIEDLYSHYALDEPDHFVLQMIKSVQSNTEDFSWLENPRVCYFTWIYLNRGVIYSLNRNEYRTPQLPVLNDNCSSTESRIKIIKQYFDSWDINIENKIEVVHVIKNEWQSVDKFKHPFQKLMEDVNDKNLIEWTWRYILDRIDDDLERSRSILQLFSPTTLNEKYQAIFAIHDHFYTRDKNLHKVFCSEYKRALSQKKFREKENIKTINFQVGTEYKQKLDDLLYYYQYSQQRFFEMLIKEHYNSVKDSLDKMQRK